MNRKKAPLLIFLIFGSSLGHALTMGEREYICPFGGEKFTVTSVESYTQFGQRLDLKPLGALIAPIPLPVCPKNGFIIYKSDFSEAEIEELRPFILSDEYQRYRAENTDYFLLAKIFEYKLADEQSIAFLYLKASWEAEKNTAIYKTYLGSAIKAYEEVAQKLAPGDQASFTVRFLLVELNRLRGEFEEAKSKLVHLREVLEMQSPFQQNLLELEQKLILERNSEPQKIPSFDG